MSRLVAARGGYDLMPEMGYKPTNKYLPPRARTQRSALPTAKLETPPPERSLLRFWRGEWLSGLPCLLFS